MTNEAKPTITPKLRFPEFQGVQGWETKDLGRLFFQREETGGADLRLLSLTDKEGIIPQEDSNRRNNASVDRSKYLRVVPGDIAYNTMRMWEGRSALSSLEGVVSPAYTVCTPKSGTDSSFFAYYFKTPQMIEQFARYSQGLVKDTLNLKFETFSRIAAATPIPAEQQKIAECLSALDELIGAESQKLDALKAHKMGLMQQLFPREGETIPRFRFPEFQDAPEWELYPFDEFVAKSFYGTSSSTSAEGRYPVLRMGNMANGGLYLTSMVYIDLDPESFESYRLEDGDILLNRTNSPALVGKISLFQFNSEFLTASYIVTFRLKKQRIDPSFCNYMLNTPLYQAKIKSLAKPSISQANINPTTFRKDLIVSVPAGPEQQHIASCLSSLDELIAAQRDKLEALKIHKRGLMQQLFPLPLEAKA